MHSNKLKVLAIAVALASPLAANAESNVTINTGTINATARVNFSILIPRFIFLQVGTGTPFAANATIDTIDFAPAITVVGNNTPVAGTGGNLTGGSVTVRIVGNAGNVTLAATGPANLTSGTDTIPWTQIATATTGGATHPVVNGANATFTAASNVVNINGTWVYSYLNNATPAGGTYTGQVLYTATTP
ncbi:MAG: hypothetical protein ACREBN_00550 [Burkholderiaceae bacterium]